MTKNATKAPALTPEEEIAKLKAELEASRNENQTLKTELEKKKSVGGGRKAAEFPADRLVAEDTILGKVQRLEDRSLVYDAIPKLYRAMGYPNTCESLVRLAEEATAMEGNAFHGKTVEEVVTAVTTRAAKGPRAKAEEAPKTVGEVA